MRLAQEWVEVLRCPLSGERLEWLEGGELAPLEGRAGDIISGRDALLVTESRKLAYPVEDGFPILLVDRAIVLERDTDESS